MLCGAKTKNGKEKETNIANIESVRMQIYKTKVIQLERSVQYMNCEKCDVIHTDSFEKKSPLKSSKNIIKPKKFMKERRKICDHLAL